MSLSRFGFEQSEKQLIVELHDLMEQYLHAIVNIGCKIGTAYSPELAEKLRADANALVEEFATIVAKNSVGDDARLVVSETLAALTARMFDLAKLMVPFRQRVRDIVVYSGDNHALVVYQDYHDEVRALFADTWREAQNASTQEDMQSALDNAAKRWKDFLVHVDKGDSATWRLTNDPIDDAEDPPFHNVIDGNASPEYDTNVDSIIDGIVRALTIDSMIPENIHHMFPSQCEPLSKRHGPDLFKILVRLFFHHNGVLGDESRASVNRTLHDFSSELAVALVSTNCPPAHK